MNPHNPNTPDAPTTEPLLCLGEITVQYNPVPNYNPYRITGSRDTYDYLKRIWPEIAYRESFFILCLNRCNEVIGFYKVSTGGVSGTVADPKIIFQVALGCHASSIILAHNHPSGNLTPSQADRDLTRKLREAGKALDCPVLDHIIMTPMPAHYFSFADDGILY